MTMTELLSMIDSLHAVSLSVSLSDTITISISAWIVTHVIVIVIQLLSQ